METIERIRKLDPWDLMHNMIFSDCQQEKIFLNSGLVVRIMPSELEG